MTQKRATLAWRLWCEERRDPHAWRALALELSPRLYIAFAKYVSRARMGGRESRLLYLPAFCVVWLLWCWQSFRRAL